MYERIKFLRDVVGWWEDYTIIKMGGPGKIVEGDGMFVMGKLKCGVGRYHSKEHVYVCTERKSRKIRRIAVPDKSANALSVFDDHILPNSEMCVDAGTENTHFKNLTSVTKLHEITGPIHVDKLNRTRNTQTVESSHSGVKIRLRSGRGVARHNLQAVLDLEDFIYNRTNGTPQDIFKKMGDIATIYCKTRDTETIRHSITPVMLTPDKEGCPMGLNLRTIRRMCSSSIFDKAASFEVRRSALISTQGFSERNTITGEYRAVRIHDQMITWMPDERSGNIVPMTRFNQHNFSATCTCKYYKKETVLSGKLCSHVIRQLRRTIHLSRSQYLP